MLMLHMCNVYAWAHFSTLIYVKMVCKRGYFHIKIITSLYVWNHYAPYTSHLKEGWYKFFPGHEMSSNSIIASYFLHTLWPQNFNPNCFYWPKRLVHVFNS